MRETNREKIHSCDCSISTSGYGSSSHYFICSACAGEGFPKGRFLDYYGNGPQDVARQLYRSSMTRVERLTLERSEHINGATAYLHLLTDETFTDGQPEETTQLFRELLKREVNKIRAISKEIGPVRPLVKTNSEDHE